MNGDNPFECDLLGTQYFTDDITNLPEEEDTILIVSSITQNAIHNRKDLYSPSSKDWRNEKGHIVAVAKLVRLV